MYQLFVSIVKAFGWTSVLTWFIYGSWPHVYELIHQYKVTYFFEWLLSLLVSIVIMGRFLNVLPVRKFKWPNVMTVYKNLSSEKSGEKSAAAYMRKIYSRRELAIKNFVYFLRSPIILLEILVFYCIFYASICLSTAILSVSIMLIMRQKTSGNYGFIRSLLDRDFLDMTALEIFLYATIYTLMSFFFASLTH